MRSATLALLVACCVLVSTAHAQTARENASYSSETEPLKPLGKKFLENVLLDQKDIWTSPFHISRSNAKWWLLFGAVTGGLIATDHWTSRQLPNTHDQIHVSRYLSDAVYMVAPVTGGFYLAGVLTNDSKERETGLLGAQALTDGLILFEALKLIAQRQRPFEGDGHGHFFSGGSSFPSGHSMSSFALASVVAHEYPNWKVAVLAYGLAGLVSASRFTARKHFASDIVAPAAMGWLIGTYVFDTRQSVSRRAPRIRPLIQPAARAYGISLSWNP